METFSVNQQFCQETLALKNNIEVNFLELGKRLAVIRDEEKFYPQWENWADYCDEAKLSESTASRLIGIYQKFVVDFGISPQKIVDAGGWSRAAKILPMSKSKEQVEELLHKSSLMTQTDFFRTLAETKNGVDQRTCRHDFVEVHLKSCRLCHLREKVLDADED